jgi:hypothetical protein
VREEPLHLGLVLNRRNDPAPTTVKPAAPEYMEGSSRGRDSTRASNGDAPRKQTAQVIRCVAASGVSARASPDVPDVPAAPASFLRRRGAFAPAATTCARNGDAGAKQP